MKKDPGSGILKIFYLFTLISQDFKINISVILLIEKDNTKDCTSC